MSVVKYVLENGEVRTVEAGDGESLMRIALANDVDGIVGECGGELSCGTCHVYVGSEWIDRLPPVSADETDLIELAETYREGCSRLGCQIVLSPELDGIRVDVAPGN